MNEKHYDNLCEAAERSACLIYSMAVSKSWLRSTCAVYWITFGM